MNNVSNYQISKSICHPSIVDTNTSVLHEGDLLFRMGDKLDGVYMVNSGAVKLFATTESGDEHIIRFCMPGDLLGLGSLGDGISRTNAVVLDIANVSLIPISTVLSRSDGFNLGAFMDKIATTMGHESEHSLMLSRCTAGRRLAWFLMEFSRGQASRGLSPNKFIVPMIRSDIALFLGLAVETVSRELARLCKQGIVKKNLRHIEILDLDRLRAISEAEDVAPKTKARSNSSSYH